MPKNRRTLSFLLNYVMHTIHLWADVLTKFNNNSFFSLMGFQELIFSSSAYSTEVEVGGLCCGACADPNAECVIVGCQMRCLCKKGYDFEIDASSENCGKCVHSM